MKKKKLPPTGMAARYEAAWNSLVNELPEWKKLHVIEEPFGRLASEVAREAASRAEDEKFSIAPTGGN